ncbi:hypothetical protein Hdeb2414_s0002g00076371 [Helianthus debilis subsp. tardiflorus]|nr:hypothetical protein HanLR1_Chr16g0645221 [Helianthus annuus]KAJ0646926.1 hypothetical protein HanOQP8_Chr16g0640541 [Helianthus annuus]
MFPEELTLPERYFNVKLHLDFLVEKVKCSLIYLPRYGMFMQQKKNF